MGGFWKKLTKKTITAATDAAKEVIQEKSKENEASMETLSFFLHIGICMIEILTSGTNAIDQADKVTRTVVTITKEVGA